MNRKCLELLEKARRSKNNLAFDDLLKLARCAGFELDGNRSHGGSHNKIFKRPTWPHTYNAQPRKGQAKPAQVRELLKIIALDEGDPE